MQLTTTTTAATAAAAAMVAKNEVSCEQLQEALSNSGTVDKLVGTLERDGILLIHSQWDPEESSQKMLDFVDRIGVMNTHNDDDTSAVWDVRPMQGGGTGARSHTDKEFTMHTDCCFEECPPRYMALFCQNADKMGGGLSKFIDCRALVEQLLPSTLLQLQADFEFRVPQEFFKGQKTITGPILTSQTGLWRYRGETVLREKCTKQQLQALDELDEALACDELAITMQLPTGCMLVMDNSKWFHARTSIRDPTRWLKRVRFHPKSGPEPSFRAQTHSACMGQCVPAAIDLQRVTADKSSLIAELCAQGLDAAVFPEVPEEQINPYPFAVSRAQLEEQRKWCALAHTAICRIVNRYFDDEELSEKKYLRPFHDPNMRRLLDCIRAHVTSGAPSSEFTSVGSWRPDMLFPADRGAHGSGRTFEVCEINARFPFNGFYSSAALGRCAKAQAKAAGHEHGMHGVEGLEEIPEAFARFFDGTQPLGIVKGQEKGGGVHIFKRAMDLVTPRASSADAPHLDGGGSASERTLEGAEEVEQESKVRWVRPEDLCVDPSTGGLRDAHGPLPQLSLELKQAELAALPEDVLMALCKHHNDHNSSNHQHSRVLNDLRTVALVHDKRLLAVLGDVELMQREEYLGSRADAEFLASRIVRTLVVEAVLEGDTALPVEAPELERIFGAGKDAWLLKPNLAGKGFGVLLGRNCSEDEWRTALHDPTHRQWVLQPVCEQAQFQIAAQDGARHAMHVVGLLHNLGGKFFGPGIFRADATKQDIVNVANGSGTVMAPVVRAGPGPASASAQTRG